jgi:hypothetical protein
MPRDYTTDAALRPQPKRDGPDYWPTTADLAQASVTHVLPHWPPGLVWEPAAGNGVLVDAWRAAGREVIGTDLFSTGHDFLTCAPPAEHLAVIGTNPPNHSWDKFRQRALELMDAGVCDAVTLLARHDYLQAGTRVAVLNRAAEIVSCNWRVRWIAGSKKAPRWSFRWVTWRRDHPGPPVAPFLEPTKRRNHDKRH